MLGSISWVALALSLGSAPDAGAVAQVDAGPGPGALSWTLTLPDGGALDLDGGVPADADLRAELQPRLSEFRLRLLDGSGHQVPATENVTLAEHTEVQLHLDPPLQPGTRYAVVVEPDATDAIRDAQGHSYAPARLDFRTAGEPPARKPKPLRHKRRRRRH